MGIRWAIVGLFSALAGSALASFELVLVADNGQNNFATRRIHRFDGPSGAYLGSFGRFTSNITSTILVQETNSLLVSTNDGTFEYDYNTGAQRNAWSTSFLTSHGVLNPAKDRVYFFNTGSNQMFFTSFPELGVDGGTTNPVPGSVWTAGIFVSPNQMLAWDDTNKVARLLQFAPGGNSFSIVESSVSFSMPSFGQIAKIGGRNQYVFAGTTGTAFFDPVFLTFPSGAGPAGASTAHSGYFLGFENAGNGFVRYYSRNRVLSNEFGNGILARPVSMQTVLAPEPATLAALTLGLAAILRRRRPRA